MPWQNLTLQIPLVRVALSRATGVMLSPDREPKRFEPGFGLSINGRCRLKSKQGIVFGMLFGCLSWLATSSTLAQTRGGALTLRFTSASPIVALLAGILILIFPRLLNYIVAIYLILIGLLGLLGR